MRSILLALIISISSSAISQDSLNMSLLYHWKDSSITGSSLYNNAFNEIWGYASNGREYAIIGSTLGTHFFDVTDPVNSQQIDLVIGRDTGANIVHRDYHDYNGYLYAVTDEGDGSLQIIDLSYLPDSVHVVYDDDSKIKLSHNIFIDSATGKLYSCGTNRFEVYDLTNNPTDPDRLVWCNFDIPWWNSTIGSNGYVHDLFVRNDTAYLNAGNGLYIVDFSTPTTPVVLGSFNTYPDQGYNHSGWLSEDGKTYCLADETWGKKVKVLDVNDVSDIQFIDTIGPDIHPNSIPHNLIIKGNYLYVSFYVDGTYIWDISIPSSPRLVGFYDTSTEPHLQDYRGNWGIYPFLPSGILLASDMQEGLFIFDVQEATSSISITENKKLFNVYPNPTKGEVSILGLDHFGESFDVTLTDINGKIVFEGDFENQFLSKKTFLVPQHIESGIYILHISNKTYRQSQQIIKQ